MSMLFSVNFTNNAWVYVNMGYIILNNGYVLEYNISDTQLTGNHSYEYKYKNSKHISTINMNILNKMIYLLNCVNNTDLPKIVGNTFDKGTTTYTGFLDDEEILIEIDGDTKFDSNTSCAKSLISLLNKYTFESK